MARGDYGAGARGQCTPAEKAGKLCFCRCRKQIHAVNLSGFRKISKLDRGDVQVGNTGEKVGVSLRVIAGIDEKGGRSLPPKESLNDRV